VLFSFVFLNVALFLCVLERSPVFHFYSLISPVFVSHLVSSAPYLVQFFLFVWLWGIVCFWLPTCVWPLPACDHDSSLLRRLNKHLPRSVGESTPFSHWVFITPRKTDSCNCCQRCIYKVLTHGCEYLCKCDISVFHIHLQVKKMSLVGFQAVSQLVVIGSPIGWCTALSRLVFGRGRLSL
jgi:hypothetical protein